MNNIKIETLKSKKVHPNMGKFNTMRAIIFFVFITITSFPISAQNTEKVKWYTIEEALKQNAAAPRKIMIDVYTDWCGWCKKMDAETFDHPVIARYINKNFYPVKFDAESSSSINFNGTKYVNQGAGGTRKSTHQFATALGVTGYPTVAYLTGDLQLIAPVSGYFTPEQIEPLLHFIVEDKFKTISFEDYQKTFISELKKK